MQRVERKLGKRLDLSIHDIIKLHLIGVQETVSGARDTEVASDLDEKGDPCNHLGFMERIPGRLSSRDHLFRRMFGDTTCVSIKKKGQRVSCLWAETN